MTVAVAFLLASLRMWQGGQSDPVQEQRRRDAVVHYQNGQQALHAEAFEKAEREFRVAVGLDPLLTLAHYGLGQAYMGLKQYADAVRAFQGCREAFLALGNLGGKNTAELDRRRTEEIQALRESIAILRRNATLESRNQNNIRQMEERVRDLERMGQSGGVGYDVPAEVPFSLGSAYYRAGSLSDAEREYQAALKANPKLGEAHSNLAVIYLLTERPAEAKKEIQAAEKAGYRVNPQLKKDIDSKLK